MAFINRIRLSLWTAAPTPLPYKTKVYTCGWVLYVESCVHPLYLLAHKHHTMRASVTHCRDIFQKYNLTVPNTWDEFNAIAKKMNGGCWCPGAIVAPV